MSEPLARIHAVLESIGPSVIACSGGIDSLLLSIIAHRRAPDSTIIAHAISPAVPDEGTARVRDWAASEGWALQIVQSGEFQDENYLSNPVNRCYFCKSNLYASLDPIASAFGARGTVLSGANLDDLGEYRPGLIAASESGVRHPWVEAECSKADIRGLAALLDLPFADLPASPCLASRLYTGTRVTAERLRAIHDCENLLRERTGIVVLRCRIKDDQMLIEVSAEDRARIDDSLLAEVGKHAAQFAPEIARAIIDPLPYRAGRAFVGAK